MKIVAYFDRIIWDYLRLWIICTILDYFEYFELFLDYL